MMPNTMLASYARTTHNDHTSSELRVYARDEWRSQVHWIRLETGTVSLWERFGRWLRGPRPRGMSRPTAEPEPSPVPEASAGPSGVETDCLHPAREELGLGGAVLFLRCCACGDVLVVSREGAWSVSSTGPAPGPEPSCV